jgi:hypothetical protein
MRNFKTIEQRFFELSDDELKTAFLEYEDWRKTGILRDGVTRRVYDEFTKNVGIIGAIHLIAEPLLYVLVKRFAGLEEPNHDTR